MRPARRRMLIALGALVAANLAAYLVFTLPRSLQQRNLGSRLKLAGDEVRREKEKVAALKDHFDLLGANTRDTNDFYQQRIGARGATMVPLLREIEDLARSRGLHVGSQNFAYEPVKGLPLDRFQVKMPVDGTYRELMGFVEELERSSRFVTLDQITVRGQREGKAELQLVLSCYFRSSPGRQGT